MSDLLPGDYSTLLGEIKQRIRTAQYEALKAVNKELIGQRFRECQLSKDRFFH